MNKLDKLKKFQKQLRTNQTIAETKLWYYLRNRNICGHKFRRQQIICGYIVDFVCYEMKMIIELDGGQHSKPSNVIYDSDRTKILENAGFKVLRFWNNSVMLETQSVLETIFNELNTPHPRFARPLPQGER